MPNPSMLIKALKGAANFIGDLGARDRTPYDEFLSALEEGEAERASFMRRNQFPPSISMGRRSTPMPDYLHLRREADREGELLKLLNHTFPTDYRPLHPDFLEFNETI